MDKETRKKHIETIAGILNWIIQTEQEDFATQLDEGGVSPLDENERDKWDEEVDLYLEMAGDSRCGRDLAESQLNTVAEISKGHIYCDAYRLENVLGEL